MSTNEPILPAEEPSVKNAAKARKIMIWATVAVSVVVLGVILYIFAYREPAIAKGDEAIAAADRSAIFENNDSTTLALYEQVANTQSFNAGNRAILETAIRYYQQGDYQKALDYVSKYDASDNVVGALAYGLKGDCLVNLDRNADAIKAFDKAISQSDKNPMLVPYFLGKKATVLMAEKKYDEAAKIYGSIEQQYPNYAAQNAAESRRVQAEALAGK